MAKSHSKLIYILITLFVIATVFLLSSCGQSNPVGASSTNPAKTTTNSNAFTSFPSGGTPKPLPAWMNGLSPASVSCLLKQPNLNLNATSPNKKPFNEVCGTYHLYAGVTGGNNEGYTKNGYFVVTGINYQMAYTVDLFNPVRGMVYLGRVRPYTFHQNVDIMSGYPSPPLTYPQIYYTIPCDDPCLMGGSFPQDAFTGNGAGQGPFVDGNGNLYDPDTPSDPKQPRKLVAVGISPDTASVSVRGTTSFAGTAYYVNGSAPYTSDITNLITSVNPSVATVSNGVATGISDGQATLKVTLTENGSTFSAVSVLDVGSGSNLQNIDIEPAPITVSKGETKQLKAIAHYPNSVNVDITSDPSTTWTLGNVGSTRAASVNSTGMVTGLASGTAIVQASYQGKKSPVVNVTVLDKKLQSISVSPASATIYIYPTKGTKQYTASGSYSDGSTGPIAAPITWDTLPGGIATIDANGLATAVSPGTTYITAASDSISSGAQDAELCVECRQSQQYWLQNDATWYNDLYATYTAPQYYMYSIGNRQIWYGTIGGTGCAMTCIAMALTTTGTSYTPRQLNQDMISQGYYNVNDVNFDTLVDFSNGAIKNWYYTSKYNIKTELDKCNIVIVMVHNSENKCAHWVYITGYKGDTYYIHDPANTNRTTKTINDICETGKSVAIAVPN